MKIEWIHEDSSDTMLESWQTTVDDVHVIISYIPDSALFVWSTNLTAIDWRSGSSYDLDTSMRDAIAAL